MSTIDQPESSSGGPYRQAPAKPIRFVCIVCFKTATTDEPGTCPCTGAGRLPIENPEVVEEIRRRVKAIQQRRVGWQIGAAVVGGIGLSLALCLVFGWRIDPGAPAVTTPFTLMAFVLVVGLIGVVTMRERKPPETVEGMLRWLKVSVSPR